MLHCLCWCYVDSVWCECGSMLGYAIFLWVILGFKFEEQESFLFFMRMGCIGFSPSYLLVVGLVGFLVWVVFQLWLGWVEWNSFL